MKNKRRQFGFSLIEVLMAVGILMVGLLMVAGTFPVGIHLVALSTERTLGSVVADEAFAKIRLYGSHLDFSLATIDVNSTQISFDFNDVFTNYASSGMKINSVEFEYPSTTDPQIERKYSWSALFRFSNSACQITVFASRKVASGLKYYEPDDDLNESDLYNSNNGYPIGDQGNLPKPIKLDILSISTIPNKKKIVVKPGKFLSGTTFSDYITNDSVIVDDKTGNIYRVIEVDVPNNTFYIDRDWQASTYSSFWVVPPPIGGGKNPCVGVYQRLIN